MGKFKTWVVENKELLIIGGLVGAAVVGFGYLIKLDNEAAQLAWAESEKQAEELAFSLNAAIDAAKADGAIFYPVEAAVAQQ